MKSLYMVVLGGKPDGRHTEQHDVFFGIASALKELVPDFNAFWPEMVDRMHIDSWRRVRRVGQYEIQVIPKEQLQENGSLRLFFVNLGGYKPNDMEEYHYKQLVVAENMADAMRVAKESVFWKHHDSAHVDDKYGIDVDDIYHVEDLLSPDLRTNYQLMIQQSDEGSDDPLEVGYLTIKRLLNQ
ncbi:MAG: DUF1543 domain-containing protein [Sphingobacterium sp.]